MEKEYCSKSKSTLKSNLLTPSCKTCDDVTVGEWYLFRQTENNIILLGFKFFLLSR